MKAKAAGYQPVAFFIYLKREETTVEFSMNRYVNKSLNTRTLGEIEVDEILMMKLPYHERVIVNCQQLAETIALSTSEFFDELWTAEGAYLFEVSLPGGRRELTADELKAEYQFSGYELRACVRDELYGKPKLTGFNGPMWNGIRNGVPVIRYEHPKS